MVVKVSFLALFRRNFMRAHLSCANNIQIIPQINEDSPNTSDFEANIRSLKNKLHPETLTHALSSISDLDSSLKLFKWASLQNRFRHSADTYYQIIMKLGMAGKVDDMEGFCNEMMKGRFSESEKVLLGLIDEFIRYHKLDEAMRILFILNLFSYKASIDVFNGLLGALMKEKKGFQSVLFVYKEMVKASIVPTTETVNYMLEALFDDDRVDAAVNQYRRMMKKGCCPNSRTYEIMVSGLIGKNLLDEAIVVLDEILETGCKLELNFFSHILPLLFRINKHEVGMKLFEKMKASKVVPISLIYEVLIQYFCNKQCIDGAINLLNEMICNDLKPQDSVFVDLIHGFQLHNILLTVEKLFSDHKVLNPAIYNTLIKGLWKEGYKNEARRLVDVMLEKGWVPDATTHRLLIGSSGQPCEVSDNEKVNFPDEISSILSEGFGEF